MRKAIQVGVIEDQQTTRESLVQILSTGGLDVIAEAAQMETALETWRESPDVLLLDIGLPRMSGVEGLPLLAERFPNARILMLTVHGDDGNLFEAIRRGASGYLMKDTPSDRLLSAIREVHEGGVPLSPALARRLILHLRDTAPPRSARAIPLTPRELDVLQLISDGHSYKSCAAKLELCVDTVRTHVRAIYDKLHVHTKSEAVMKAARSGWLE